jgi:Oxidoreductase molybdopterin binding domain
MHPHVRSQPWQENGVSTAQWTGTSLSALLSEAQVDEVRTCEVLFRGADRGVLTHPRRHVAPYERSLPLSACMHPDVLLVYAMNGHPLPAQHGAPLRLLVPGYYGMASVKWLCEMRALLRPFLGFQMLAYRLYEEVPHAGDLPRALANSRPCDEMLIKSVLKPPGLPLGGYSSLLNSVQPLF